jgi:PIN domain nuclease of toxin-antitoxin system
VKIKALLDTNAFLWWATNDRKLSAAASEAIANSQNEIYFSIVSAWEIVIKAQIGKLPLPESPEIYIPKRVNHYGFITMEDVLQIWQLAAHHNDPFDRLLIAQSQVNQLPIITADTKFSPYNVNVIW